MTGTFFVITGRADAHDPAHMNWAQINEMAQAGMSMEPHTKYHRSLRERNPEWGVRDLETVAETARGHGLALSEVVEMPANNLSVVFLRG